MNLTCPAERWDERTCPGKDVSGKPRTCSNPGRVQPRTCLVLPGRLSKPRTCPALPGNYKLDAKGQKLEYTYDTNNRVTKITPRLAPVAPATVGEIEVCNVVEYFYDGSSNTYGRLAAVQYGSKDLNGSGQIQCPKGLHREEFSYTNGGRPASKTLKLTRKFADLSYAERTAQMSIAYEYTTGSPPYQ